MATHVLDKSQVAWFCASKALPESRQAHANRFRTSSVFAEWRNNQAARNDTSCVDVHDLIGSAILILAFFEFDQVPEAALWPHRFQCGSCYCSERWKERSEPLQSDPVSSRAGRSHTSPYGSTLEAGYPQSKTWCPAQLGPLIENYPTPSAINCDRSERETIRSYIATRQAMNC